MLSVLTSVGGMDLFYKQLYAAARTLMLVILDGITYVERTPCVYVLEMLSHIEGYAVEHLARCIIHKLKLDMLQIAPYKLARTKIHHFPSAGSRV